MDSTTKEPLSRLNDVLSDEIAKLPKFFLARLLKRKIVEAGHTISDEAAEAFAAHLFSGSEATFEWDDGKVDQSDSPASSTRG